MSLATYIKRDLADQIRKGKIDAEGLTLTALSRRYQVSVSPVRTAIEELISEGHLRRDGNRRLALNGNFENVPRDEDGAPVPEAPKDWLQTVTDDLVQLSLNGEPVLLREEVTAEKYGISRSSIRQIFHQLAGRGILEHLPRRGWRLRSFRQEDLDAYIEIRATLELKALELAWPRLVDEDIQHMLSHNTLPENPDDEPLTDNSIHAYLIDKARNPYIAEFFERHGKYYRAIFDWEGLNRGARLQAVQQHREILTALLKRDRRTAALALENHIRNNHPVLRDFQQIWLPGPAAVGDQ